MLALRNLARSVPRSTARLSTKTIRQPSLLRQAAFQPAWAQSAPRLAASFHISAVRRQTGGSVNEELVAKLQNEIAIEEDMKEDEDLSANIKEYLETSPFEIEDKPGQQEVILTRTFGDEKIQIVFSTADLDNGVSDEEFGEQEYDGEIDDIVDAQSGGANSKGAINQGKSADGNIRVAPEDSVSPADREELDDEYGEDEQGFPAKASIRIERPGKGALAIDVLAQDGDFLIEDLWHLPSADLAAPKTAEQEWQRRSLYVGPPFSNLDEDLQILLEKYLEEREINTRLALFIPDYIDHKEQKEYIRWLKNVKSFVE
ncbi:mitochondrial glyco protein [Aaosphaeria arxii CBS 175.79]|uniref:Mitochondrial glyco protein n=1 Tax=Aaosphaeria arxii CBS 175.79 TaxID=1450172 RepID=A0A6A5XF52_9PLEO|nr:mitochondrial glyco protein [Aaosphaeria arxii CBS 175.79]KAF2011748.1 mitochondrial glyco protein [Aaosphaeria arxii CBS 175.79]